MAQEWKYISDQIETETATNVKKAMKLSLFHDTSLNTLSSTMPLLLPLYNRYHPLHVAFVNGYSIWESADGGKQGDRITVEDLLVEGKSDLVNTWVPAILVLYTKLSARYKAIFPKGLYPFNTKGIDSRIGAYKTLGMNIGTDAALATTKTAVESIYDGLLAARSTQTGAKTNTSNTSGTLELLRVAAMEMQYRNLGNIMDNLFDVRETVCPLVFDLVTLRVNPQTVFTGNLKPSITKAALANTFVATDTMSVKVSQACKLYLSNTIGGINSIAINVPANIKTVVDVSGFGVTDFAAFRYLTIVNEVALVSKYSITLL